MTPRFYLIECKRRRSTVIPIEIIFAPWGDVLTDIEPYIEWGTVVGVITGLIVAYASVVAPGSGMVSVPAAVVNPSFSTLYVCTGTAM